MGYSLYMTNEDIASILRSHDSYAHIHVSEDARDEVIADTVADLIFTADLGEVPESYGSAQGYLYGRVNEVLSEVAR